MGFNNRILVIDDDASVVDVFREVLTARLPAADSCKAELESLLVGDSLPAFARRTFQVDSASQGEEGIEKIKAANARGLPYGLVFTDMRMPPGLDGVETAIAIRKIDPAICIVLVTAFSDASISEIVRQVGFTDRLLYLKKPFDDEEILQLADSLIMRWNLEQKAQNLSLVLGRLLESFLDLEIAYLDQCNQDQLVLQAMASVAALLDTNDILLAQVQNQGLSFVAGLGAYQEPASQTMVLSCIAWGSVMQNPIYSILRVEGHIIVPVLCGAHPKVLIARLPEVETEGADQLLAVLVKDSAKVLDTALFLQTLQRSVDEKQACIQTLIVKISALQQAHSAR